MNSDWGLDDVILDTSGTAEIEDAINTSDCVIESAVVGFPHDIKGQGIFAYVVTEPKIDVDLESERVYTSVMNSIEKMIGKIAKPDKIVVVSGLPKTRSGKIMRRILRKIAEGERTNFGDTSTLLDPGIVDEILQKVN
jgi:acetyl-CoA synthetase